MAKELRFVDVLVTNPDQIPDMILLNGFSGKSSLEGYTRLYLNAVLNEYYEIPADCVLHTVVSVASGANPLETSFVWVKADAELIRKGKSVLETKTRFFTGPIQGAQAAQANPVNPNGDAPAGQAKDGPTGVQNCTQAAAVCGDTAWPGCPPAA